MSQENILSISSSGSHEHELMEDGSIKEIVNFSAPLHIVQNRIVVKGVQKTRLRIDQPQQLLRWFKNWYWWVRGIFVKTVEGRVSVLEREGYYWVGPSGQLEKLELPEVDEATQVLRKQVALQISMDLDEECFSSLKS